MFRLRLPARPGRMLHYGALGAALFGMLYGFVSMDIFMWILAGAATYLTMWSYHRRYNWLK